jgi:hypothetical protein
MEFQQLTDNIHRLTRDHRTTHTDTETGRTTYPTELALLTQLRQEQGSGSRNAGSGTSGSGSRSPIALQAVMLWSEIRETLNTRHIALTGRDEPALAPEVKLRNWGVQALKDPDGHAQENCARTTTTWIRAIEGLLHPVPKTEIVGACPAPDCGQTHAWTLQDGEYLRNTALTISQGQVSCAACGTTWAGNDIHNLAAALQTAA